MVHETNNASRGVTAAWRFRARCTIIYAAASALASFMFGLYLLIAWIVELRSDETPGIPAGVWALLVVSAVIILVAGAVLTRYFSRCRRLPHLVEEHDGAVCPTCVRALDRIDDGDDGVKDAGRSEQRSDVLCRRCGARYEHEHLRWFWGDWPWPSWAMKKWYLAQARPRSVFDAASMSIRRWIYHTPFRISLFVGMMPGVPVFTLMYNITPPIHWSAAYLTFRLAPLVLFGAAYAVLGFALRCIGREQAQCRKCRYQKHIDSEPPARCPECGSWWNVIGGTKFISFRIRPALAAAGTMLLIGGFTMWMLGMTHNLPQRFAANDTLIDFVLTHHGKFYETAPEWRELRGSRELTDAQRHRLVEGMLDRRDAGDRFRGFDAAWLGDQLSDGLLSTEQRERLLSGMIHYALDGPHHLRIGETGGIEIITNFRHGALSLGGVQVYFGGFRIDTGDPPSHRADESVYMQDIGRLVWNPWPNSPPRTRFEPKLTITAESPGEISVAADLWIVVKPSRTGTMPIIWNDDGTPEFDEETVIWKRHVALQHRVSVVNE